jgi:hypothetical protein
MFIVVSKWAPDPAKADEWKAVSEWIPAKFSAIPGIEFMHRFINEEGHVVVMMGYTDRAAYDSLVTDPNGAVAKDMAERNIEAYATWVSSERGETFD